MTPATAPSAFAPDEQSIAAMAMPAALAARAWTLGGSGGRYAEAILLIEGEALAQLPDGPEMAMAAPALLFLPQAEGTRFHLEAGGRALNLSAGEDVLRAVIAESPIASDLRAVLAGPLLLTGEALAGRLDEIWLHCEVLLRETRMPGPAAAALTRPTLGLILVHLWRAMGAPSRGSAAGASLVPRFRQLIEMHFRQNLPVSAYARMLGVTRGRLHAACRNAGARAPLALVHQRLLAEAVLRLETTDMPVEQIAYSLGFRDAGYFNRFFTRRAGQPPGAWRRAARNTRRAPASFAAWP